MSLTRVMSISTHPPMKPASTPSRMPTTATMATTQNTISSEVRPPQISRERIHLPI